ncbi:family 16 glycosylhydrolase [Phenylobacterium sp. LjRoot225]|uniref:family 16 glycosylhydrolase n=1 Tax=Phenylobacterium sp. LjRoot225 TaxID=3342285 RepID=UPI003ECE0A06
MASGYTNYSGTFLAQSAPYTVTVWGSGTNNVVAGNQPSRLVGSNQGNSLVGGAYDDTLSVINVKDRYSGGGGVDTVVATVNIVLPNDIENLTMDATWSPVFGVANDNANIVKAVTANVLVDAKGGDDVIVSFGSKGTFIFEKGSGQDIVHNFHTGATNSDVVRLVDYGFDSFAKVTGAMTQTGSDVLLKLSASDLILFKNTTVGAFTAENFQLSIDPSKLKLTFAEEFNSLSLQNKSAGGGVWATSYAWADYPSKSAHNIVGEREIYVDPQFAGTGTTALGLNPFSVSNGVLTISPALTPAALKSSLWNFDWTSGVLTTKGTFAQTYGYFEMRADLPDAKGAFPAFWLLPADGKITVELDVVEYIGENNTLYNTMQHGPDSAHWSSTSVRNFVSDLSTGFHTFGLLWTPETLTWYVDGTELLKLATPVEAHKPMYMLVNYAVGGGWAGNPTGTTLPGFAIDYIRAYSLEAAQVPKVITGTSAADTLTGTDFDDTLNGAGGIDRLLGGKGNDLYQLGVDADVVVENAGEGTDLVTTSGTYVLPTNVENLTLTGVGKAVGIGNASANLIIGNSGANQIEGRAAADTLNGAGGDDTIIGGGGDDSLTGSWGADTFTFGKGDGHDTITDFGYGADVLNLSSYIKAGYTPTVAANGADTVIQFTTGEWVRLVGVQPAELVANAGGFIHV